LLFARSDDLILLTRTAKVLSKLALTDEGRDEISQLGGILLMLKHLGSKTYRQTSARDGGSRRKSIAVVSGTFLPLLFVFFYREREGGR